MVYYTSFRVPQLKRTFLIAKNEKGVCNIAFNNNEKQFVKALNEYLGDKVVKNASKLKAEVKQIQEYFAGKRKSFNLKVVLIGTKFQSRVWLAMAKVKYGETVTYTELARRAGNKNAFRAAATCCATNPVAVIIPCHRVVAKSGLGGFGGGIPMKKIYAEAGRLIIIKTGLMIRNIIFDLGNVLVNVEYERFQKKIYESGVDENGYTNFFKDGNYRLLGYESGEISSDEFISKCINGLSLKMTEAEYAEAFNDMFSEIKPMSDILKRLAEEGNYNLFLLSNTSPLHFEYIKQKYDYVNLLHKFGLSYELKSLKPDGIIYERAIEHLGINPAESLFIDDLKENCEGAQKYGIKTICYDKTKHADFVLQFEKLLNS